MKISYIPVLKKYWPTALGVLLLTVLATAGFSQEEARLICDRQVRLTDPSGNGSDLIHRIVVSQISANEYGLQQLTSLRNKADTKESIELSTNVVFQSSTGSLNTISASAGAVINNGATLETVSTNVTQNLAGDTSTAILTSTATLKTVNPTGVLEIDVSAISNGTSPQTSLDISTDQPMTCSLLTNPVWLPIIVRE
jgi:hypothetical protein